MPAGKSAVLAAIITGDSSGAQRALQQLDMSVAASDTNTKKAGKSMGGVWAAVAAAVVGVTKAASDLEQATGAVAQIFGDMAPEVMEWAEGMAQYGLSTAQAAQAAAILGGSLSTANLSMETTAALTTGLIELSADLVAVYGGSMPQAVAAMGSAMRAEYDPLEQYGIFLTADAVAAEEARLATMGLTFESERQAQVVATLSLIWQQSIPIQQAAEDEMDSLATTTARAWAETKNLAAALGDLLLPILQPLIDAFGKLVGRLSDTVTESELLHEIADLVTQTLNTLVGMIEEHVVPILERLGEALEPIIGLLEDVVGVVQSAVTWFDNFTDSVHEAIDALTFWNDTYDPNADTNPSAVMGSQSVGARGRAGTPTVVTINVTAEATDPYALARLLTRQLEQYANVQGRRAGQTLAGAW